MEKAKYGDYVTLSDNPDSSDFTETYECLKDQAEQVKKVLGKHQGVKTGKLVFKMSWELEEI